MNKKIAFGKTIGITLSAVMALLVGSVSYADQSEPAQNDDDAVVETAAQGTAISDEAATGAAVLSGVASHGSFITVPTGTTMSDWVLLITPRTLGTTESGSEKDNALLYFYAYATVTSNFLWKIHARYKYRFWNSRDGVYRNGTVNYALMRR